MDIKWQKKRQNTETDGYRTRLVAVLVDNGRKNGATAQAPPKQLGAIGEKFLATNVRNMRAFHQGLFWVGVDRKLDQLGLSLEERGTIEAQITPVVPRPPEEWALWGVTCIPDFD